MTLDSQTRGVVSDHLQGAVPNGHPSEKALIRCWRREAHGARGRIVCLAGQFTDAAWFRDVPGFDLEESGLEAPKRFPRRGNKIVLCEAKSTLNHQLIGQAVVYRALDRREGAEVQKTVVLAERGLPAMIEIARDLELTAVVIPLETRA